MIEGAIQIKSWITINVYVREKDIFGIPLDVVVKMIST